jgi:hypothetical protein
VHLHGSLYAAAQWRVPLSDGQRRHPEVADGPTYTCSSGMSRKMYLLQAWRLNGRQAWMGPRSRCRAPH